MRGSSSLGHGLQAPAWAEDSSSHWRGDTEREATQDLGQQDGEAVAKNHTARGRDACEPSLQVPEACFFVSLDHLQQKLMVKLLRNLRWQLRSIKRIKPQGPCVVGHPSMTGPALDFYQCLLVNITPSCGKHCRIMLTLTGGVNMSHICNIDNLDIRYQELMIVQIPIHSLVNYSYCTNPH